MGAVAEAPAPAPRARRRRRSSVLFPAPRPWVTAGWIVLGSAALAYLFWPTPGAPWAADWLLAVLAPTIVAGVATGPLASALGGRFEFHRSMFLALSSLLLELPLAAGWRGALSVWPSVVPSVVFLGPFEHQPVI